MNIEEFITELQKLNINLSETQISMLITYKNMLQEYNQKFNLTSLIKDEDIYLKHFYDSLTLTKALDLTQNLKVLDIGTGAGFPGLVLKIVFPNLDLTLVESNNKKISFLNAVITKLELTNIKTLNTRAENLPSSYREYFDLITSRAVSHLRILAELSLPFLKVSGLFIPMKGNATPELQESETTLTVLNAKVLDIITFKLPFELSNRSLIKITKLAKTPNVYPRSYDKIIKKILK